jgi:tyrosyl-tRNA synthetase
MRKRGGLPEDIPEATVKKGTLLIDVLVEHSLVSSKSEARRLIGQNGIKLNDKAVTTDDAVAEEGVVKVGKRKFLKISIK